MKLKYHSSMQSILLQRLAAELAVAIQPIAAAEPTPEPPRKKPPVAKAQPQEPSAAEPKIPVAEPIKIDTEVFRF